MGAHLYFQSCVFLQSVYAVKNDKIIKAIKFLWFLLIQPLQMPNSGKSKAVAVSLDEGHLDPSVCTSS